MKVVLSIDISPKLNGGIDEEELAKKLEKRCNTLLSSIEKKWVEQNEDLCIDPDENEVDEVSLDWAELIQEGFSDLKKSVTVRVWGRSD